MVGGRPVGYLQAWPRKRLPRNNSSLVVRAELEPATSGFQVRRPNHSATLQRCLWYSIRSCKRIRNNQVDTRGPFRKQKVMKRFRTRKAITKSQTLQSYFIHIFLILTDIEVRFMQEVKGAYNSVFRHGAHVQVN